MIFAGDIGGTKTNLGLFSREGGRLHLRHFRSFPSQEYSSLTDIVREFRKEVTSPVSAAAFGIAGPVIDGRTETTNISWVVDSRELAEQLGIPKAGLINDLEATAYGILELEKKDLVVLNQGIPREHGAIAVIAAGTGLGEGGLFWDGERYRAIASEGGHSDFAPRNDLEIDLLRFLLGRYSRVSYERAVSGPGLYSLYEFFRSRTSEAEPAWLAREIREGDPSAAVSQAALSGKDKTAGRSLETFVSLYGAEAGNLALKLLATGGLFVGGGIAPKILDWLKRGPFLDAFMTKGRYTPLLKNIPVSVVLNDKTALLGAGHFAVLEQE
jgi:glucokinase